MSRMRGRWPFYDEIRLAHSVPSPTMDPAVPTLDVSFLAESIREVAGWFNDGWEKDSFSSFLKHSDVMCEANPYWYNLGTSDVFPGSSIATGAIYHRWNIDIEKCRLMQSLGKRVIPTIGDSYSVSKIGQVGEILKDDCSRKALIENIVSIVTDNGYDGIDLNFEGMTRHTKSEFSTFLTDIAHNLHKHNKLLSVTLQSSDSENYESLLGYDLADLKNIPVDQFKIMAYDHNYDSADIHNPSPIAPIQWVKRVLEYMLITRGLPAEKTQLALHNYAYIWEEHTTSSMLLGGFRSYLDLISHFNGTEKWTWDDVAKESYVEYLSNGKRYAAYFGCPKTVSERVRLADEFGTKGVAFWVLGREHPQCYDFMKFAAK